MTEQEQRIAIAEACGWRWDEVCQNWKKPSEGPYAVAFLNNSHCHRQLPDYLHDLNAMHEAEKVLKEDQRWQYMENLASKVEADCFQIDGSHAFKVHCSSSAQRAEAFLRTLNLWREDK